ncbi:hypothetical protein [Hyunsoonleella pacifica]|uniref:PL28 ulvan lyase domain-containing protein n=1 Tax=Hyunsoonleella pacifica TaxID=1080224 RepID=A0A4Q9FRH1_9FLAO|nr:hypothetical protein [Hyunsoonleella pacifica]TBN16297.1 hypothetical protein EYD46_06525 [Hyunsoonleella pacifica]GGD20646.1 hypothetical protein GCM10011368_23220 [Hyunsoonleella pacifica]
MKKVNLKIQLILVLFICVSVFSCSSDGGTNNDELELVIPEDPDPDPDPNPLVASDEDTREITTCTPEGANTTRTSDDLPNPVNIGTIDDRTCYSNYSESIIDGVTWGVYNITDGSNNQDAANTLQPRMERSLPVANSNVGSSVKFTGDFRILEVADAGSFSQDGSYIAQAKGQHTGGGGSPDPAICLYRAHPVYGTGSNADKQVAFDIYAERILERGGSGSGREVVLLKRVNKNEITSFVLEVGFKVDSSDSSKKVHYCNAIIGGEAFNWNIPDPERGTQSKIRYGAYRVRGGRAQIRWANTTHDRVQN